MCVGIVRLQGERALKAQQSLIEPFQLLQRTAAVVECMSIFGIYLQRKIDLPEARRMIALLRINDTEQVQTISVIGLNFQNLSINFLCFSQSTSLMKRHRLAEC